MRLREIRTARSGGSLASHFGIRDSVRLQSGYGRATVGLQWKRLQPVFQIETEPIMSLELYQEIIQAQKAGEQRVLATVSSALGSTPRKPGASMLLRPDGSFIGTIGGGCGEAEVWQEAMETMADGQPRTVVVDLTQPIDGDDKICGGVMRVFVERIAG